MIFALLVQRLVYFFLHKTLCIVILHFFYLEAEIDFSTDVLILDVLSVTVSVITAGFKGRG